MRSTVVTVRIYTALLYPVMASGSLQDQTFSSLSKAGAIHGRDRDPRTSQAVLPREPRGHLSNLRILDHAAAEVLLRGFEHRPP